MAETIEQNYDWLIIFLVYNNNYYDMENQDTTDYYTMEEQTKYILRQIRNTEYNKKVKTIFVEAEIKNKKPARTAANPNPIPEIPVATLSMLYKKEGTWLSAVDRTWRESESITILTNGNSLREVLVKLKQRYNAEKHMIITAGHGSIVGINYYIPELLQKSSRSNEVIEKDLENEKGFFVEGKYRKELVAEREIENGKRLLFLANQEICNVLKEVFPPDDKLDVLVMYNCLMQNIFTQFELRETVDWLVAPLSGISIPGFNYGKVLNEISMDPGIDGETVSKSL